MGRPTIFQGLLTIILIALPVNSFNFTNLGIGDFQDVLKLDSVEATLSWLEKMTAQCKANNVKLDMAFMLQRYMCLSQMDSVLISGSAVNDNYMDKVCEEWPKSSKCLKPLFKKLERCFSYDQVDLTGVLTGGIEVVKNQLCKHDTSFLESLTEEGPELLVCLSTKAEALILNVVQCFTKNKAAGVKEICEGYEVYQDCFMKSVGLCKNPKAERFVHKLVHEAGFRDIIYSNILKCDPETPKVDQKKENKSEKSHKEKPQEGRKKKKKDEL